MTTLSRRQFLQALHGRRRRPDHRLRGARPRRGAARRPGEEAAAPAQRVPPHRHRRHRHRAPRPLGDGPGHLDHPPHAGRRGARLRLVEDPRRARAGRPGLLPHRDGHPDDGGSTTTWSEFDRYRTVGAMAREMLVQAASQEWKVPPAQAPGRGRRRHPRQPAGLVRPARRDAPLHCTPPKSVTPQATQAVDADRQAPPPAGQPGEDHRQGALRHRRAVPRAAHGLVSRAPVFGATLQQLRPQGGARRARRRAGGAGADRRRGGGQQHLGRPARPRGAEDRVGPRRRASRSTPRSSGPTTARSPGRRARWPWRRGTSSGARRRTAPGGGRVRRPLPRPRADGAAERHGEDRGGPLRDLDRHAVPDARPAARRPRSPGSSRSRSSSTPSSSAAASGGGPTPPATSSPRRSRSPRRARSRSRWCGPARTTSAAATTGLPSTTGSRRGSTPKGCPWPGSTPSSGSRSSPGRRSRRWSRTGSTRPRWRAWSTPRTSATSPARRITLHSPRSPVTVLWWRSVGNTHTAFAMEWMIDELAKAAGTDPLAYRLPLLRNEPRHRAALQLAADKAGWGQPLARRPRARPRGPRVVREHRRRGGRGLGRGREPDPRPPGDLRRRLRRWRSTRSASRRRCRGRSPSASGPRCTAS